MPLKIDTTQLNKQDRIIPRCQVIDLGSGAAPRNITVQLSGPDGARVLARYYGFPTLAVDDYVRLQRRGNDGQYDVIGSDAGTAMIGGVWPAAGELSISDQKYTSANDFFDNLGSGDAGIIGESIFVTDYSESHATIVSGVVGIKGQGIDVSILSNTDTGDAYGILVSASCLLQDFTVENDAAAASTAIAVSLNVSPRLINVKARGDAAGNAANAVGISAESFEATDCIFIGEGSTGNNYAVNVSKFGTSIVKMTDCFLSGDLNVSGSSVVDIYGGLIDGDISTASSPVVTFHNLPTITGSITADCVGWYYDSSGTLRSAAGWQTWTPTITQGVAVTKTINYADYEVGIDGKVTLSCKMTITGAGTGGSIIQIGGIPVNIANAGNMVCVGAGIILDTSVAIYNCSVEASAATTLQFIGYNVANRFGAAPNFALAAGDIISFTVIYEPA